MKNRETPWLVLALVLMAGFVVWLFAQMTRDPRSARLAWILAGTFVLVLLLMTVLALLDRRARRDH